MRCWLLLVLLASFVGDSTEYCYTTLLTQVDATECITKAGVKIAVGDSVKLEDQCERCSCNRNIGLGRQLFLVCCGYGIHGGVMSAPPGCKIVADDDGCTPKLVQVADETKLC